MKINPERIILVSVKFDTNDFHNKTDNFGSNFVVEKGKIEELAITNKSNTKLVLVRNPTKVLTIDNNIEIVADKIHQSLFDFYGKNENFVDGKSLFELNNFFINFQLRKYKQEKAHIFLKKLIDYYM